MKFRVTENCKYVRLIEATELESEQLYHSLKKKIRGHFYNPLVKKKIWDGSISFIKDGYVQIGLWNELFTIGETFNYPVEIYGLEKVIDQDFDPAPFRAWVAKHFEGNKYQPRDYQIDSAIAILKYRVTTSEIATSSGKTLITFLVYGYLKSIGQLNKMLIIVPNVTLVMQLNDDFEEYNDGKIKMQVRMVYGGAKDNDPSADIIVGTFQSLVRKELDYFKGIDVVCGDECLDPNSKIELADGTNKFIKNVQIGDEVVTLNEITSEREVNKVIEVFKNMNISSEEEMYEIETEDGRILRVTGNHKLKLIDGTWKEVKFLTENDELVNINKKNTSYYD